MKKAILSLVLLAAGAAPSGIFAAEVAPYKCDFNSPIDTSNPNFKVAQNWSHVPDALTTGGSDYYMSYTYYADSGYEGGHLYARDQKASEGSSYYDETKTTYDILVTPKIKGEISLRVKPEYGSDYSSYIEFYNINDDGSRGDLIKKFTSTQIGSTSEWSLIRLSEGIPVSDYARIGMRCCYVRIDDFEAESAIIEPEPSIAFASVTPTATSGTLYWDQQANGKVGITWQVSITNDGQVDLTSGMEGYSISLINNSSADKTVLFTIPVPCDLAIGETSDVFEVSGEVETSLWPYSSAAIPLYLREDINKSVIKRANSSYRAYEPKLIFREWESSATSSLRGPVDFGFVTEAVSRSYELYNDGNAPLVIDSYSAPEGFDVTGLEEGLTVLPKEGAKISVALPAETKGAYSGNLVLNYTKQARTESYTLGFTGTVIGENDWSCTFGEDEFLYPKGSIADSGISKGSDNYLNGASNNANFILPLLHAEEGDVMSFQVARNYYNASTDNARLKFSVYKSKDRLEWGEPMLELSESDVTSTDFVTRSIIFDEAGDWFVKFVITNGRLDNIAGLASVDNPYDFYIKSMTELGTLQSGQETNFRVSASGVQDLAKEDYTIELIGNDEVLLTLEPKDIVFDAKNTVDFSGTFSKEVETNTEYDAFVKVTFTAPEAKGKTITSEVQKIIITNQPDFVFLAKDQTIGSSKPANYNQTISFGNTNTSGIAREYEIYNWGTAPLSVTSITVADGFSVNISEAVVAPKERRTVAVTLTAETPGKYEGQLVISYLDADSDEQTFSLPVFANMLDPEKWYAPILNKENSTSEIQWPAGTIHGKNLDGVYGNSGSNPYIYSSYTSDNMLVSPKLHVEEGDGLDIYARLYSSNWPEGYVNVYTSDSREGLASEETRTLVARLSGSDVEDPSLLVTADWEVKTVNMPQAGDFYIGLEFGSRLQVNYLYGLKPVAIGHDLVLADASLPADAMQNVAREASISVHNFGLKDEKPGDYAISVFIDGEKVSEIPGTVEIPMNFRYEDAPTSIPVSFRYSGIGTFPVYLELTAGDFTLQTDPVEVTFSEEVFSAEKQIGEIYRSDNSNAPVKLYNNNSESVMLYSSEALGLNQGDRIASVSIKGNYTKYSGRTIVSDFMVYYKWVDDKTLAKPGSDIFDLSDGFEEGFNKSGHEWVVAGTVDNPASLITINFETPEIYTAGKSLMIYAASIGGTSWESYAGYGWCVSSSTANCYYRAADRDSYKTDSWSETNLPVLFVSLDQEPTVISGTVYDGEEGSEDAVVTLVSTDGDNIRYSAVTDAQGAYSLKVIQNSRRYNITAVKGAKEDFMLDRIFESNANDIDFDLLDVVTVDNTTADVHEANSNAIVKLNLDIETGHNALVLPFSLSTDEATELFGDGCEILYYKGSELKDNALRMYFAHETESDGMIAGKPYLVNVTEKPVATRFKGKTVIDSYNHTSDANAAFTGTYEAKNPEPGMVLFKDMEWVPVNANARSAEAVAPYSAYVKVNPETVKSVAYTIDDDFQSSVDEIESTEIGEDDVIFNLQGIRVYNPGEGIYIVNGKKTVIRK